MTSKGAEKAFVRRWLKSMFADFFKAWKSKYIIMKVEELPHNNLTVFTKLHAQFSWWRVAKFVVKPFTLLLHLRESLWSLSKFSRNAVRVQRYILEIEIFRAIKINFLKEKMGVLSSKSLKKSAFCEALSHSDGKCSFTHL